MSNICMFCNYVGMTFKVGYKILMKIVLQQWGCTWEWDPKCTKWRITLWQLTHRTGIILLHGGKVNLKEWVQNKWWKSQGLTTTAGAWIPKVVPEKLPHSNRPNQYQGIDYQYYCPFTDLLNALWVVKVKIKYT